MFMKKTIIFLSGFAVPNWLSKTKLVWNDKFWKDYDRVYIESKIPLSDNMVSRELDNLSKIINSYNKPIVVGQSLGGWWAANLACQANINIDKLVLWTPVCHAGYYPIFNVTERHSPMSKIPNANLFGPHKVCITWGNMDWLVPPEFHAAPLKVLFDATTFGLNGGHWFQSNHDLALSYIKEWIEL